MSIVRNAELPVHTLPGIEHRTVAGHAQGARTLEVWVQTMAPGATTPVHRHACEEVILVLSGSGRLLIEGEEPREFEADSTLILSPDRVHQLVNTGSVPLTLVAALGTAPVRVRTASGEPLPVPWEAPEVSAP